MFAKNIGLLALTSVAALLFKHMRDDSQAAMLEAEIACQLNALRDHLFKP